MRSKAREWFYKKVLKDEPNLTWEKDQKRIPAIIDPENAKGADPSVEREDGEYEVKFDGRDTSKCDCERILLPGVYELCLRGKKDGKVKMDVKKFKVAKPHAHVYGYPPADIKQSKKIGKLLSALGYSVKVKNYCTAAEAYQWLKEQDSVFVYWGHGWKTRILFKDENGRETRMGLNVGNVGGNKELRGIQNEPLRDVLLFISWGCLTERAPDEPRHMPKRINMEIRDLGADIGMGFCETSKLNAKQEDEFITEFFKVRKDGNGKDYLDLQEHYDNVLETLRTDADYGWPPEIINELKKNLMCKYNGNLSPNEPKSLYPPRYGCAREMTHGK